MSKQQRISLCDWCAPRFGETNDMYEIGKFSTGGICHMCNKWKPVLKLYEYENKDAAKARRAREEKKAGGYVPKHDGRAHYKEPWRNW